MAADACVNHTVPQMKQIDLKARHVQHATPDPSAENAGPPQIDSPDSVAGTNGLRSSMPKDLTLRIAEPFDDLPTCDVSDAPSPVDRCQLNLGTDSSHIAEFHLALGSVGARFAHPTDNNQSARDTCLQRTWAALAASLVSGQRLRILHIGAGTGVEARAQPYRVLVCGQGIARDAGDALALARRLRVELQVALEVTAPTLGLRDASEAADLRPWRWPRGGVDAAFGVGGRCRGLVVGSGHVRVRRLKRSAATSRRQVVTRAVCWGRGSRVLSVGGSRPGRVDTCAAQGC
jgi:hypothetical protein